MRWKKWLRRFIVVFVVCLIGVVFVACDGIQRTLALTIGHNNKVFFDASPYKTSENCTGATPCASGPIKVMSFNIMCRICDKDGYDTFDQRRPHFLDMIARYDADLLGLQELGLNDDIQMVLDAFPEYDYVTFHWGSWSFADPTLFYRRERFEVLDSGQMWLSPTPTIPLARAWKLSYPRYVNWACLRQKKDGFTFLFLNTHFDNAGKNKEPSALLYSKTFGPMAATLPIIATGDFNTDPTTERYKNILGGVFEDTANLAVKKDIVNNLPVNLDAPDKDILLGPEHAIDHILLAGPGKKEVARWAIDSTTYGSHYRRPSDHPAVYAEVNLSIR